MTKAKHYTLYRRGAGTLISLLLMLGALVPAQARAGIFSDLFAAWNNAEGSKTHVSSSTRGLQTFVLPRPAMNIDPTPARGGGGITIVDNSALLPQEGPSGTIADIEKPTNDTVSHYIVRAGDTVSSLAKMFQVSEGTIRSFNDLKKGQRLVIGQDLVIMSITSVPYTVKKGDTLASIAKRYGGDPSEIANYNGVDDATLAAGVEIVIPNGEVRATAAVSPSPKPGGGLSGHLIPLAHNKREPAHGVGAPGSASDIAYYEAPLSSYKQTQGIHGYNAVDLGAPEGTPIVAAASGDVVVAREGGWNGGYGSYVVISHDNGSQTLYAHMSQAAAYDGESVQQGQVIGYVGQTGLATGPHLHFEIRNGIRNPF